MKPIPHTHTQHRPICVRIKRVRVVQHKWSKHHAEPNLIPFTTYRCNWESDAGVLISEEEYRKGIVALNNEKLLPLMMY